MNKVLLPYFLICSVMSQDTTTPAPTLCVYTSSLYIGETILPTGLTNQLSSLSIYSYCLENENLEWKYGVTDGTQTSTTDEIDYNLFFCQEGFYSTGYIPLDSSTGLPLGSSGVTIGVGVDLGYQTRTYLSSIGIEDDILDELDPYFGETYTDAAEILCLYGPLELDSIDAYDLSIAVIEEIYLSEVSDEYDQDSEYSWDDLTKGVRTVITSMYYINGNSLFSWLLWQQFILQAWDSAIINLRTWQSSGNYPSTRYEHLANILEASIPCQSDVDIVFLIDSSGSVSTSDYTSGLDFMVSIVNNFDTNNGTVRFGASQFSSYYTNEFFLNSYFTNNNIITAINNIPKNGGGTSLAAAMEYLASDQFIDNNGMRSDDLLVPRVAIIITDGRSGDGVNRDPLEAKDVTIIAIGIGNYDEDQLNDISDDVYFLTDYDELINIITDISSLSCYASSELTVDDGTSDDLSLDSFETNYYTIDFSQDMENIQIIVDQSNGCVYVYVSYCTEFPSYYSNLYSQTSCDEDNKIITIDTTDSVEQNCTTTRRRRIQDTVTLYIAVEGIGSGNNGSSNIYSIEISECDANNTDCEVGSNQIDDSNITSKICQPIDYNSTESLECYNKDNQRDCVGYYDLCIWSDIEIETSTSTSSPCGRKKRNCGDSSDSDSDSTNKDNKGKKSDSSGNSNSSDKGNSSNKSNNGNKNDSSDHSDDKQSSDSSDKKSQKGSGKGKGNGHK